ncbi:unnamed protein product [Notodromas monacha]|uniref:Uncharacterized protein n=1 Tax=Notodromas monacha TaxID=399045 RepID=A0A7R9GH49_9CRUS|nr:unnamed protein product [Notodromas monacha]CAG0922400.1 unnamed protein product [Notodromas monacha]
MDGKLVREMPKNFSYIDFRKFLTEESAKGKQFITFLDNYKTEVPDIIGQYRHECHEDSSSSKACCPLRGNPRRRCKACWLRAGLENLCDLDFRTYKGMMLCLPEHMHVKLPPRFRFADKAKRGAAAAADDDNDDDDDIDDDEHYGHLLEEVDDLKFAEGVDSVELLHLSICVWNSSKYGTAVTGRCVRQWEDPYSSYIYSLDTDRGNLVVAGYAENSIVRIFDCRTAVPVKEMYVTRLRSPIYSVSFDTCAIYAALDVALMMVDFNHCVKHYRVNADTATLHCVNSSFVKEERLPRNLRRGFR